MSDNQTARAAETAEDYGVVLAQERLIVEAQTAIHRLLVSRGLKQSDLAQLLGVSAARVSQMFGDEARNLTLRTIARIFHVLGTRCRLEEDRGQDGAAVNGRADVVPCAPAEAADTQLLEDAGETDGARNEFAGIELGAGDLDHWFSDVELLDLVSEDAAFAKRSVWVFGDTGAMVVANENQATGTTPRHGGPDARRWVDAESLYAFG